MQNLGGPDDVRAALAAATAAVRATLPERAAVRRYQRIGKDHAHLNAFLRGRPEPPLIAQRLLATRRALDSLMRRAVLPADVVVFRGLRDMRAVVPPASRLPATGMQHGFVSTTLRHGVALEFAEGGRRGGVLRIVVPRGTNALWLPPLGDPGLADEEELLLQQGTFLTFLRWRVEVGTVEVDCEVES